MSTAITAVALLLGLGLLSIVGLVVWASITSGREEAKHQEVEIRSGRYL